MFVGPVFSRELVTAPRRARLFLYRAIYPAVLLGVMCTAWLILTGTQVIHSLGDMARFGTILFQLLAPLQLAMITFFAALSTASAVAQEKDRKTLVLLLLTRMNNSELVLGKLMASLLYVLTMICAGLPVFAMAVLFGGISFQQVIRVFLVTLVTALAAGSLGSTLALWRDKTFQTLAMTCLGVVFWMVICEALHAGVLGESLLGWDTATIAMHSSPARAIFEASRPAADLEGWLGLSSVSAFLLFAIVATGLLNGMAIWKVRRWNPSREIRKTSRAGETLSEQESIWGAEHDVQSQAERAERARAKHVDVQLKRQSHQSYRRVWHNPILWREVCTWAYGRKVVLIRVAYVALFILTVYGVYIMARSPAYLEASGGVGVLPLAARPIVPFLVVSLVVVNALAVTSITTERDGRSLDLLLVTDLSPKEFLFGKLAGVLWVAKEMVLLPVLLCLYLWWDRLLSAEDLLFVVGGFCVMTCFVAMLGIHCGSIYANSRTAVVFSLGTVFFLFVGIATCIVMMISFSGAFHVQLAPFLAFILGGGVGLYVTLGVRNPSPAIMVASLLLPFATFYAITSYLLQATLAVFLVTAVAYSFATAAMMVPALAEFDFSMGRGGQGAGHE